MNQDDDDAVRDGSACFLAQVAFANNLDFAKIVSSRKLREKTNSGALMAFDFGIACAV